jgi:hypothetical protein
MNFKRLFNQVATEFNADVALLVVQINTISLSLEPTLEEIQTPGLFGKRVEDLARNTLWETDEKELELALTIERLVYDWEISQDMNGLGGCVQKTFKELLGE